MPGFAHPNARRLGLAGSGDGAAIVVGKDDQRNAAQLRIEGSLTGAIEAVAVDQTEHHGVSRTTAVTIPQTSVSSETGTSSPVLRTRSQNGPERLMTAKN